MAAPTPKTLTPPLSTKVIHQFPIPTWVENLVVRNNGQILVTLITAPELHLIDPSTSSATLIHRFEGVTGVTGIIEVADDVFYVGGGKFDIANMNNEPDSYHVWEVDMRGAKAAVKEIAHVKDAGLLNGFELLSKEDGAILMADSEVGVVWKLNVRSGTYEKVVDVEEMKFAPPPALNMGINGIKIRDGYLYWSNTSKAFLAHVKIDDSGKAVGKVEIVEQGVVIDDFVFDKEGRAWLATNPMNTVVVVEEMGDGGVVAVGSQNEFTVAGGTACQFGRGEDDKHVLYLVTSGAMAGPINGTEIEGGKIVAIDTRGLAF